MKIPEKTFQEFIDQIICRKKENDPYSEIMDAKPYKRYRTIEALVSDVIHQHLERDRFYHENRNEIRHYISFTVLAMLFVMKNEKINKMLSE